MLSIAEKEIAALKTELESYRDLYNKEKATSAEFRRALEEEKKAHQEDNATNREKLEKLFNQAKLDLKAKQVVIKKLETTNAELQQKLTEEGEKAKESISIPFS